MNSVLPVVLLGLAGVLFGGAWSLYRQKASRFSIVLTALLGALSFVGGVLWLFPGGA